MSDLEEIIKQTTKFVKRLDELQPHEPGYEVASRVERRNRMRDMEDAIQKKWQLEGTFQEDADDDVKKFFCNFPYPYMNGLLHLGHAFTITKADFAARYQRLKGKKVLFPFAFHCTGMPIQAAAHKLQREIQEYGLENCQAGIFVRDTGEDAAAALVQETQDLMLDDEDPQREPRMAAKKKGTKTKLMAKTGAAAPGKRPKSAVGDPPALRRAGPRDTQVLRSPVLAPVFPTAGHGAPEVVWSSRRLASFLHND